MGIFKAFEAGGHEFAGAGCCFCGQVVQPGLIDPVAITLKARADRPRGDGLGAQTLWCHAECLDATGAIDFHVTRPEFWEDTPPEE